MTYFVSLKWTAIIIGLLSIAGHLPPALAPEKCAPWLSSLPRNYPLGVVLMLAATALVRHAHRRDGPRRNLRRPHCS
jgi:hypothetical protein